MKFLFRLFLLFLLLIFVIPILVLGYLGFIPALAGVFGANKPKNLGITYTTADLETARQKNGVILSEMVATPSASQKSIEYSGTKNVSVSLTSQEITSLANFPTWKYFPVSHVQIKVNPDGSSEASGILLLDRLPGYLSVLGIPQKDLQTAADYLKIKGNTPFYFKGIVSVTNNQVSLDTQKLEIGRLPIPESMIKENQKYLAQLAEIRINSVPGMSVESFNTIGGKINFKGTLPQTISWQK